MERLLIVPAAGLGSRLGGSAPKLLAVVNGRPMLDHLLEMYARVDRVAVVVHPTALDAVRRRLGASADVFVQEHPTGMLDAILLASPAVQAHEPRRVLITWCDQVGIHPRTIERLMAATAPPADPPLVLPTCQQPDPYIHLERDSEGIIRRVLHRREGDPMPAIGESDAGLFDLSRQAFVDRLPDYARRVDAGSGTGERNFLPFIPWIAQTAAVTTFPCVDPEEAIGVNTPDDLIRIERYLRGRGT
jgi:bifunctional N-acetylglucosamine-1-phosphate-uridyltransferase/glucosamine-1-phosphate-acetyltransferase GlmU-like protein